MSENIDIKKKCTSLLINSILLFILSVLIIYIIFYLDLLLWIKIAVFFLVGILFYIFIFNLLNDLTRNNFKKMRSILNISEYFNYLIEYFKATTYFEEYFHFFSNKRWYGEAPFDSTGIKSKEVAKKTLMLNDDELEQFEQKYYYVKRSPLFHILFKIIFIMIPAVITFLLVRFAYETSYSIFFAILFTLLFLELFFTSILPNILIIRKLDNKLSNNEKSTKKNI